MATTTPYWQLEKEYYTIAESPDAVLRIIERTAVTTTENGFPLTIKSPSKLHEFKIHRATLSQGSTFFDQLLNRTPETFAESTSDQNVLDVAEDGGASAVRALALWFKIVHGKAGVETYEVGIDDVWRAISVAQKYGFFTGSESAAIWFNGWYKHMLGVVRFGYKHFTTLLYPAFVFDHCEAFKEATRYVVYHNTGGYIPDHQPREFKNNPPENASGMRMPQHIMQQVNSAKNRLKTILHRALYTPIDRLLKEARCHCAPRVLFNYETSLARTGVWPLESKLTNDSVLSAIHELKTYEGKEWQIQTCGSQACSFDFDTIVNVARGEINDYFSGLCLDCMKSSKSADAGATYWSHSQPGVNWDHSCRISHGQPSWYFSYMGPREDMMTWAKAPKVKPIKDRKEFGSGGGNWHAHHNNAQQFQGNEAAQEHADPQQLQYGGQTRQLHTNQYDHPPRHIMQSQNHHQRTQYSGGRDQGGTYNRRGRGARGSGNVNFFDRSRYGNRHGSGHGQGMDRDMRVEKVNDKQTLHDASQDVSKMENAPKQTKAPDVPTIRVEVAELQISAEGEANEKSAA